MLNSTINIVVCPLLPFITLITPLIITYYYAEGGYIIDHDENS
jgi:hypothetical protein